MTELGVLMIYHLMSRAWVLRSQVAIAIISIKQVPSLLHEPSQTS